MPFREVEVNDFQNTDSCGSPQWPSSYGLSIPSSLFSSHSPLSPPFHDSPSVPFLSLPCYRLVLLVIFILPYFIIIRTILYCSSLSSFSFSSSFFYPFFLICLIFLLFLLLLFPLIYLCIFCCECFPFHN